MPEILDADPQQREDGKNTRWAFRFLVYAIIASGSGFYGIYNFESGVHSYETFQRNQLLLNVLHWSTMLVAGYFVFQATTMQENKTGKYQLVLYGIPFLILLDVLAVFLRVK